MLLIGIHYLLAYGSNIDASNLLHLNDAGRKLSSLKLVIESFM
jgi:hypothetical protein